MKARNDGGQVGDISMRDYFAAQTLSGFSVDGDSDPAKWDWSRLAKAAYEAADAMLIERGRAP